MSMNIRYALKEDIDAIVDLEKACFPEAEAATRVSFEKRLDAFSDHFWLMEEDGKLIAMINGITTDTPTLKDEMYEDVSWHDAHGVWQMLFGVETHPDYQGKGYASKLMNYVIEDCKKQGRLGIVLTCKLELRPFYKRFGFVDEGKSSSQHGGATWNEMRLAFVEN